MELKDALTTVINIAEKTDAALADDGRIDIGEGVGITFSALGLIKVVKNIKSLMEKYKALTDTGKTELAVWFEKEFDIVNDNVEVIVEKIFEAILKLGDVFDSLKK